MKRHMISGISILALAGAIALPVHAQEGQKAEAPARLNTVTVTAQAREQSLSDVPISVGVVDGEIIADQNLQRLEDIQYAVPNFTLTETGISTNIFIRGIGSGINQGFEQSVGMYVDGVHYGRAQQTRTPLFDLERIEVLRGPQSILFGKNSIAGALSITTAKPTRTFEGSLMPSYEFDADEIVTEGYVSGPLSDRVRGRLALRYRDAEGYDINLSTGNKNPQREDISARGTIEVDLTDNLLARAKAEVSDFDVYGRSREVFNSDPIAAGPFAGLTYGQVLVNVFGQDSSALNEVRDGKRSGTGEFSENELETYTVDFEWTPGEFELQSKTAYSAFKYDEYCDCDGSGADIFGAGIQEDYDQFSQEIRLISPIYDHFDYLLGAYYQTSSHEYGDQIIVPDNSVLVPAVNARSPGAGNLVAGTEAARSAKVDADVLSAFGQFTWRFMDPLSLQVGARVTKESKDGERTMVILSDDGDALPAAQLGAPLVFANLLGITSENLSGLGPTGAFFVNSLGQAKVSGSREETQFSPDVKLIWDLGADDLLYASWAKGFKSGGFDFRANNRSVYPTMADSFEFEDEQAINWEVGGKFGLGGSAELNVAAFFTQYDDLQVSIFDGILGFNVGNAGEAEVKGLELDGRWAATDNLTLSGSLALTDFEFTDYRNGQCYFGQQPDVDYDGNGVPELCDYTGKSNQLVSDVQGTLGADYVRDIFGNYELEAGADVFFTSRYDASQTYDPDGRVDGYELVNLRLALSPRSGAWQVALMGKNVFDETPLQYTSAVPLSGSTFGANVDHGRFLQGRQVAVQARVNF